MNNTIPTNLYDEVPYLSEPFPLSRPNHLSVLGQLFGNFSLAPCNRASILELGCGSGNNLIPLAALSPESYYLGVDSSQSQIALGQSLISELGLTNIELQCSSVEEFSSSKHFDYIICHGLFSWVEKPAQESILKICKNNLTKNGLAYISYNTLPGWHFKSIIREAMLFHTQHINDSKQKILEARAYLNFLSFGTSQTPGPYHVILKSTAQAIEELPDWYIFHDFLEKTNLPIYFSDFMQRIEQHKLSYLCDADISLLVAQDFPSDIQLSLRKISSNQVHLEQTTDFLRNQLFRCSIVCHKELELLRDPITASIKNFYISSPLRPISANNGLGIFEDPFTGNKLQTNDLIFASTLKYLSSIWPMSISFSELQKECAASDTDSLCILLLRAYLSGTVFFDSLAPRFTCVVDNKPRAFPIARALEKRGFDVINLKHESITLDELSRKVVALADGSKTTEEIALHIGQDISQTLSLLAEHCLLMREEE